MTKPKSKPSEQAALRKLLLPARDMRWFRDAKIGLFIHWGVYAIPAAGEWFQFYDRTPAEEYAKLATRFTGKKFDADAWAAVAADAGMRYMVLTTRHHDGFCLFDSPSSIGDFTSVKTAARRDFVAEYAPACRRAGLKVGFYYSPMDWRCPGYFFPRRFLSSALEMKRQCYGQVRELLSRYGPVDVLWYDGGEDSWLGMGGIEMGPTGWRTRQGPYTDPSLWEPLKLNTMVRKLQPKIVINGRSGWEGDFDSAEGHVGAARGRRPWETCMCIVDGPWGWKPDCPVKPLKQCIDILMQTVCGDGNLLLNVGPMPDGRIEPRQVDRLREIGDWLRRHGRSVYGTRGGPVPRADWGGTTSAGRGLFVHVLQWPKRGPLALPPLKAKVLSAEALTGGTAEFTQTARGVTLRVPPRHRDALDTIIELRMDRAVTAKLVGGRTG